MRSAAEERIKFAVCSTLAALISEGTVFPGGRAGADQLHLEPGGLDRVGLPEDELSLAALPRHDPGRARLPHVAPLRTGKYNTHTHIYLYK